MFVETRTTPEQVLADVWREVNAMLNTTLGQVRTRKIHPTFITKTMIRADFHRAQGACVLAMRIGDGIVPTHVEDKMTEAHAAVAAL